MRPENITSFFKLFFQLSFVLNIIFLPNFFSSDQAIVGFSLEETIVIDKADVSKKMNSENFECFAEQDDLELIVEFSDILKPYRVSLDSIEIKDFHQGPFLSGLLRPPNLA